MMKTCSIESCGKRAVCRGYCQTHYSRFKRHGDPLKVNRYNGAKCSIEECQRIAEDRGMCGMHAQRVRRYGDPNYVTSKEQHAINTRLAQPKLGQVKPQTYKKHLGRHEHRKVAEQMLGRPLLSNEIVHHKDGDKHNNSPDNLEIMTQSEHIKEHWPAMMAARIAKHGH